VATPDDIEKLGDDVTVTLDDHGVSDHNIFTQKAPPKKATIKRKKTH
jgi:hypothetical protein